MSKLDREIAGQEAEPTEWLVVHLTRRARRKLRTGPCLSMCASLMHTYHWARLVGPVPSWLASRHSIVHAPTLLPTVALVLANRYGR